MREGGVSSDPKTQYIVDILSSTCPDQPNCLPHSVEKECSYLCQHMISCTCYDFQHDHLCKHTHKVFHLHMQQQPVSDDGESDDGESDDGSNTDISLLFGTPALQGRSTIQTYLQEIQESVKEIGDDGGIFDHTIAKLLPVVTTLHTHLDPSPEQQDL